MIHVYPKNDLRKHTLTGSVCECEPKLILEEESREMIIVHNSYDGREGVELTNEILDNKTTVIIDKR